MTRTRLPRAAPGAARALLMGLAALAAPGCQPVDEPAESQAAQPAPSEEIQPKTFEKFLAEAHVLDDGRLIIDQDILVKDAAAARAFYEGEMAWSRQSQAASSQDGLGSTAQPLTVNQAGGVDTIWTHPQRMELTYCVDTASFGTNANLLVDTLEQATYSWSRRIGVQYRRVVTATCNNATSGVLFNVRQTSLGGANASAFFPNNGRSDRELLIDPISFTTTAGGRDLLGILSHELGHTIGMRHEHIWLANPCTTETAADARIVNAYDVNSVMHYPQCRPSGTGGYRQSDLDYFGAQTLYGTAPALIGVIQ
ncbi:hypothetical protein JY651_49980 [Pyxidicoccus parkwayensis]|uniref:Peptidase metallopeptidase domain-containing protein n=1 Tax=Pyxidicoccus parkwayensis TaxID=2813578 RepID=A0ABX7P0F1_9BACT|nr:M57 family metalloprotease [Pyxidicoccus parkwaysis]QSQ23131.1 hypothetical protein JY651_49980 [Pyxidicoccus parkwaysis]